MSEHEHHHEDADEHAHDEHAHDEHEHHHHNEPVDYMDAVKQLRAQKDDYFRSSTHSPIPQAERASFSGLPYYPVDETLRFESRTLEPYTGNEPSDFQIPTSDGRLRPAHRAGILAFDLGGERRSLTGYTFDTGDDDSLFVPFLDATSGTETYGAGRYLLDAAKSADLGGDLAAGTLILDFNFAFQPSCAFDPKWACPLAPPSNRLDLPIRAGERLA